MALGGYLLDAEIPPNGGFYLDTDVDEVKRVAGLVGWDWKEVEEIKRASEAPCVCCKGIATHTPAKRVKTARNPFPTGAGPHPAEAMREAFGKLDYDVLQDQARAIMEKGGPLIRQNAPKSELINYLITNYL
jgi:hypothetical protein